MAEPLTREERDEIDRQPELIHVYDANVVLATIRAAEERAERLRELVKRHREQWADHHQDARSEWLRQYYYDLVDEIDVALAADDEARGV